MVSLTARPSHYLLSSGQTDGTEPFDPNGEMDRAEGVPRRSGKVSMAFSPNGKFLAIAHPAGGADKTLNLCLNLWSMDALALPQQVWPDCPMEATVHFEAKGGALCADAPSWHRRWLAPSAGGEGADCGAGLYTLPKPWLADLRYHKETFFAWGASYDAPFASSPQPQDPSRHFWSHKAQEVFCADRTVAVAMDRGGLFASRYLRGQEETYFYGDVAYVQGAEATALWPRDSEICWLSTKHQVTFDGYTSESEAEFSGPYTLFCSLPIESLFRGRKPRPKAVHVADFALFNAVPSPCGRYVAAAAYDEGSGHGRPCLLDCNDLSQLRWLEVGHWHSFPTSTFVFAANSSHLLVRSHGANVDRAFLFDLTRLPRRGNARTRCAGERLELDALLDGACCALAPGGKLLAVSSPFVGEAAATLYALRARNA